MTGGVKHDNGKLRVSLIPPEAKRALAEVLTYGERKYGAPSGWRNVPNALERYTDARDRHLLAIEEGETHDAESGLPHAWHALCNQAFIVALSDLRENTPGSHVTPHAGNDKGEG